MSAANPTTDELNEAVRNLVRAVMSMPDGTVRPANQAAPAGAQTTEIATVLIFADRNVGQSVRSIEHDPVIDDNSIEALDSARRFVASVQFYRGPSADAAGMAAYSSAAFDRAVQLGQRLQLSSSVETMARMGLCLHDAGGARNLAAVADATWESRGQIDLTFSVINRITAPIQTIETVPLTTKVQVPSGIVTRTSEVTS